MTRQDIIDALTAERYSGPVKEWHQPASHIEEEARALRLIIDNEHRGKAHRKTRGVA